MDSKHITDSKNIREKTLNGQKIKHFNTLKAILLIVRQLYILSVSVRISYRFSQRWIQLSLITIWWLQMYNVQQALLRCELHKANDQTLHVSKQRLTVAQVTDVSVVTISINVK